MSLENVQIHLKGDSADLSQLAVRVTRYEYLDGIGELAELGIEVLLTDPELDMAQVVGRQAVVVFGDEPFFPQFDGIVRRCRQLSSEASGASRYEVRVVPPLWLTTLRTDHRIFQDLSIVDVVDAVVAGYGGRIPKPVRKLSRTYPKREYCVQYAESDFDFIHRILAEEGIPSYHRPEAAGASPGTLWVLDDDLRADAAAVDVPFVPPSALVATKHHVFSIEVTADSTTSVVSLRDYDYNKPEFILERRAQSSDSMFVNEGGIEAYAFEVGRFTNEKDGDALSAMRLEEARSRRRVLGLRTSFGAAAGARIAVSGLPGHAMESRLVAIRVRTTAEEGRGGAGTAAVRHFVETIPQDHPFRPRRRPKPRIYGTQTAFVVGNQAGVDEIDVDELGRVKVELRWDRRDLHEGKPTRRVRVSQGWAGAGFGLVLLPRVNEEVIISYLDGDPDEPIIVGRVHNVFVPTPLKLPDEKTQSIWRSRSSPGGDGHHQILMEDKAGEEFLQIRAQRDLRMEATHDSSREVGNDETIAVKGTLSVDANVITMNAKTTMTATAGTQIKAESVTVLVNGKVVTSVHGGSMLYLYGGTTVYINGGVSIEMSAGSSIKLNAPNVDIGDGTVNVSGGTVNVSGDSAVNIKGGSVNLNC